MSPDEMQLLYDYNAWANRRVLSAAEKLIGGRVSDSVAFKFFFRARNTRAYLWG